MVSLYGSKTHKNLENLVKPMVLYGFLQNRSGKFGKTNGFVDFLFKQLLKSGTGSVFGNVWVQTIENR